MIYEDWDSGHWNHGTRCLNRRDSFWIPDIGRFVDTIGGNPINLIDGLEAVATTKLAILVKMDNGRWSIKPGVITPCHQAAFSCSSMALDPGLWMLFFKEQNPILPALRQIEGTGFRSEESPDPGSLAGLRIYPPAGGQLGSRDGIQFNNGGVFLSKVRQDPITIL